MLKSASGSLPRKRWILWSLTGSLALACATQWLAGQDPTAYDILPYDASLLTRDAETGAEKIDDKLLKPLQLLKNNLLMGNAPFAENAANFKKYYMQYLFRSFTHPEELKKLPEKRKEIIEDLRRARSKEARDTLLQDTLRFMTNLVQTTKFNIHPAARFNALLVIGDLNADEVVPPQRFPNPMPAALDLLVAEYKKPNQTEPLRLAALLGIYRHAQLDWARLDANRIPAPQRAEIMQLTMAQISAKEPPTGGTKEGHAWMQRRSLDVLGALGVIGPIEPANIAVLGVVKDPDADISVRLTAAATLARANTKTPVKSAIDPEAQSLQLAALLVEACDKELARIDDVQKKKMTAMDPSGMAMGMGMGMGMGMMGPESGGMMPPTMGGMMPDGMGGGRSGLMAPDTGEGGAVGATPAAGMDYSATLGPKDPRAELFRRRIKYDYQCVKLGLTGVARIKPLNPNQKKSLEAMDKELADILSATDAPGSGWSLTVLHDSVKKSMEKLAARTVNLRPKPKPVPAAPVTDEPTGIPNVPAAAVGAGGPAAVAPPGAAPAAGRPAAVPAPVAAPGVGAPGVGAPGVAVGNPGSVPAVPPGP